MTQPFNNPATSDGRVPPRMRPAVAWGLGASVLASAWALWWPSEEPAQSISHVDTSPRAAQPAPTEHRLAALAPTAAASSILAAAAPTSASSASSEPSTLSPAVRDPFHPAPPPPSPAEAAKAAAEAARSQQAAALPPPPPPPPMNHVVVGRFQSPDGQHLVFVQDKTQAVIAAPGVELSTGYVIEAVTPQEIRLRHPLVEQAVSLPLRDDNAR
jgi:hypothetical protein